MSHYVCVTGGRDFNDIDLLDEILGFLHRFYGDELRVIHGAAPGADELADNWCAVHRVKVRGYPALWTEHGRAAGAIRNRHMVKLLDDWRRLDHTVQVVAFPGGKGTNDMCEVAGRLDICVDRVGAVAA